MPVRRGDRGRLEEPGGDIPSDPHLMVARYDQLIAVQERALDRMRTLREQLPPAARAVVDERDIAPLGELIRRFRERREYWMGRAEDHERR